MSNDNKNYWNSFYESKEIDRPSRFCLSVRPQIEYGSMLELGCGDGRDTRILSPCCEEYTAYDYCDVALEKVKQHSPGVKTVQADFNDKDFPGEDDLKLVDYSYSRFLWHSVPNQTQRKLMRYLLKITKKCIFIECRSVQDLSKNFVYDGHKRWPVFPADITSQLENRKYKLEQNTGFAPYKHEDPLIIRLTIWQK